MNLQCRQLALCESRSAAREQQQVRAQYMIDVLLESLSRQPAECQLPLWIATLAPEASIQVRLREAGGSGPSVSSHRQAGRAQKVGWQQHPTQPGEIDCHLI